MYLCDMVHTSSYHDGHEEIIKGDEDGAHPYHRGRHITEGTYHRERHITAISNRAIVISEPATPHWFGGPQLFILQRRLKFTQSSSELRDSAKFLQPDELSASLVRKKGRVIARARRAVAVLGAAAASPPTAGSTATRAREKKTFEQQVGRGVCETKRYFRRAVLGACVVGLTK